MTSPTKDFRNEDWTRYWPFGVAGFAGPLLASGVSRWVPLPAAVAVCTALSFAAAVWAFKRTSTTRSAATVLASGLTAGLVAGVLAFLFPWR